MKRLIALLALAFLPVAAPALADQLPAPPATAYLVRCYNPSVCDGLALRGAVDPATFDAFVRAYQQSEIAVLSQQVSGNGANLSTMTGAPIVTSSDPKHLLTQTLESGLRFTVTPSTHYVNGYDYACTASWTTPLPAKPPSLGEAPSILSPVTTVGSSGSMLLPRGQVNVLGLVPGTICVLEQP